MIDVAYPSNRRLVETFTLKSLPSNPYGIEALQGTIGYTLQEAMLMCGGGLFATLQDIYMELFQVAVGSAAILEPSQLVQLVGVAGSSPAALKELVGVGVAIDVGEEVVTLTINTAELEDEIALLRTDVDANTLELSNIDLTPYQLALTAGTGEDSHFRFYQGRQSDHSRGTATSHCMASMASCKSGQRL